MKLVITFTQASSTNMILPTIQLLRVALITILLLLLTPLITLLVVTTLIAVISLISLESRARTTTAVTWTMKAGPRTATWAMTVLEKIGILVFFHNVTVFSEVPGWSLFRTMFWAGLI